jgi:predicted DNA repair protein MutK
MAILTFLASKAFVSLFLLGGTYFCGYGLGKVKGWQEYEKIEEECRTWK